MIDHISFGSTNLYYYRARYYSPRLGRFLQTDPIGAEDDPNLYAYVINDPTNTTDPTGECPWCIGALIGTGLELIAQTVEVAVGAREGYSGKDMAVAAVAGATGVGAARLIGRAKDVGKFAKFLANRVADAGVSAGSQYAKSGEVSLAQVATDVTVGALIGDEVSSRAAAAAARSSESAVLERAASRAERIAAQSAREARQTAAQEARAAQRDYIASAEARAGTTASSVVSRSAEAQQCVEDKAKCN